MNRILKLVRRAIRARKHGVRFRGMSRTRLPPIVKFGGEAKPMVPTDEPDIVNDFVNVVLDDDYGLHALAHAPATIVDIGANVGLFSNFARHCFPDAVIHAYEPAPLNAERCRGNTASPLTTVFEEGVAANDGTADLVDLGKSNLAQTRPAADGAIALTSFATVLARIGGRIDLLKVDCEGAEWDFMRDPALFAGVGAIRMEYHLVGGRPLAAVHDMARAIGFAVTHLAPDREWGIAWLDRDESPS